jgi:nucleoside-diphosphate-sugar epimerase
MFPGTMAEQLCAKGYDVRAVVSSPEFTGLPDEEVLIGATEPGRSLVTANIRDFRSLDARYRAASRVHAGLILVSTKTFPQNRAFVPAVTNALNSLLAAESGASGDVVFLSRP